MDIKNASSYIYIGLIYSIAGAKNNSDTIWSSNASLGSS
jgi:hypothetical protein